MTGRAARSAAPSLPGSCVGSRVRPAGFTLIEVLVALAVVAIALGALAHAGARALDRQAELEQTTLATWVADNLIGEIRLGGRLQPGIATGETTYSDRRWRWRSEIQAAPGGELWRIDIDVMRPDGTRVAAHTGFAPR